MRWVLGLLLVANLAMFAWTQGWFERWSGARRALPAEQSPERLRVVPLERLGLSPGVGGDAGAPALAARAAPPRGC
jgi:hypothetical protein